MSQGKLGIHLTFKACFPTVSLLIPVIKTGQERAWVPFSKALPMESLLPLSELEALGSLVSEFVFFFLKYLIWMPVKSHSDLRSLEDPPSSV